MKEKQKQILYWVVFAIYLLFVFSPFIIPSLNSIEPLLFGTPLTVWYIHIVILLGCGWVFYGSKNLWQSYDETDENGEVK